MRRWIAAGAPASAPDAPQVVKLRVTPTDGVLRPGERQQLAVVAEYTDGSIRDVTRQAEFSSNLDVVATVDARRAGAGRPAERRGGDHGPPHGPRRRLPGAWCRTARR